MCKEQTLENLVDDECFAVSIDNKLLPFLFLGYSLTSMLLRISGVTKSLTICKDSRVKVIEIPLSCQPSSFCYFAYENIYQYRKDIIYTIYQPSFFSSVVPRDCLRCCPKEKYQ